MSSLAGLGAVLIIDPDESIRHMLETLFRRAGFTTHCIDGAGGMEAAGASKFDVIIRDVDFTPRNRDQALRELTQTGADLLQRTVLMTATPVALLASHDIGHPFAIVNKPFEVDLLLKTVRKCSAHGRRTRGRAHAEPAARDDDGPAGVNLAAAERFVRSAPQVRALLDGQTESTRELLLRNEMRRTLLELSAVLDEAARLEGDDSGESVLLDAARVAAELASRASKSREH